MSARPSSAERARRLLALLPLLREGEDARLSDLAAAAGSDTVAVADDLALLSLCGSDQTDPSALVPVLVENGRAVTFGELPAMNAPVRLTVSEAETIMAALETCGVDPEGELGRKLAAVCSGSLDLGSIARTVRAAVTPGGLAHTHARLTAAAAGRRVTRISYLRSGASEPDNRTVLPWSLFMSRGRWYLQAWDEDRGGERTFRVDRIAKVEVTGDVFERRPDLPSPATAVPDATRLPRAEIVFAQDAFDLTERDWPGATFTPLPDGRVLASVPYAGTAWIARKVAARGGDAVVSSPAEVRAAVAELARAVLEGL